MVEVEYVNKVYPSRSGNIEGILVRLNASRVVAKVRNVSGGVWEELSNTSCIWEASEVLEKFLEEN